MKKYDDEKYHIEYICHEYGGGYHQYDWTLVNIYGEYCKKDGITLRFDKKESAQKYCDKVNECSDGGIVTNFT